ncbi:hypothetical protein SCMU_06010 [Sinomonas cyclohexanicum]|uniref:Uncharacterized protein n=1 Tax=Sinomonas cyclohexanicum TaxID=322009 RepID=A0ABN6FCT1_SINCY|nr:hypothetical protein SCMU_06010 [Corynebacterium cyclohexanicum]
MTRKDCSHECTEDVPQELKERATRLAMEARQDPAARAGAFKRIGDQPSSSGRTGSCGGRTRS